MLQTLIHPEKVSHNYTRDGERFSYLFFAMRVCFVVLGPLLPTAFLLANRFELCARKELSYEDEDLQKEIHHCCERGMIRW